MKLVFIVGIGSFIGGILRYLLSTAIQGKVTGDFPYGTLTVNLVGCFVIGCLFGLAEKWQLGIEFQYEWSLTEVRETVDVGKSRSVFINAGVRLTLGGKEPPPTTTTTTTQ